MNRGVRYHVPVENRSYRIGRSAGVNAYLQRCWPHHQHKFLAYMCYKTFGSDTDIITQKEMIDEFDLNKGVVSATISKMLRRNHIGQISKTRPYWYQLTLGGEQFGRYILTHFPKYHLDIFHYFDESKLQDGNLRCIEKSLVLLNKLKKVYSPTPFSVSMEIRFSELSSEIPLEFTTLFVKFGRLSLDDRKEMFKTKNCESLAGLYRLLEEEFRIRYILTNLFKMDKIFNEMKEDDNYYEIIAEYENYIQEFLMTDYSKPILDDEYVEYPKKVPVASIDSNSNFDRSKDLFEDFISIMKLLEPNQDRKDNPETENISLMNNEMRMAKLSAKRKRNGSRPRYKRKI